MKLVYEADWLAAKEQIDRVIAYAYERERIEAVVGLIAAIYAWREAATFHSLMDHVVMMAMARARG